MMLRFILASISILLLTQCGQQKVKDYPKPHFDIVQKITAITTDLSERNPQMSKLAILNEDSTLVEARSLDSTSWKNEFKIFRELNINKPAIAGLYDSTTNGNEVKYFLKEASDKYDIKELRLKRNQGKLKELHGQIERKNYLYTNATHMSIIFNNSGQVESYSLMSLTKVISKSEEKSEVYAKVHY